MPPTELRRREQRKEDTRAALEHAALQLFAERGFDATSVDDIASAAGVSPRTFFRYFETKDQVLYSGRHERLDRVRASIVASAGDVDDLTAVRDALLGVARDIEADRDDMVLRLQAAASTPVLRGRLVDVHLAWESTVAGALRTRRARDPELTAAIAMALFRHAATIWIASPAGRPSLESAIRRTFARFA